MSRGWPGCGLVLLLAAAGAAEPPSLQHSPEWVATRLQEMTACDDAYLYNEVLGGRAVHQNSFSKPPTEPWEGSFHTQQQAAMALLKMDLYDLGGRRDERLLDQARDLLAWVLQNGYDRDKGHFYLKYSTKTEQWEKGFFPEFNMITVAALVRYGGYRPTPAWQAIAERVLARILATDAFREGRPKGLYASGYLALKLLDCYDATREARFLTAARTAVELADAALWDGEYGGWFIDGVAGRGLPKHTTKFCHINANLAMACLRLARLEQSDRFQQRGTAALEFLGRHLRAPDGGWYRHTTRDGSDSKRPPGIGDGGNTEGGDVCVYDRMAQVMVTCCLAWPVTADRRYLRWVDETLDKLERTHLTRYPVGVNYGYTRSGDYQNTWCHQWGLKALIEITKLGRQLAAP